jgi:hypothetical protein
MASMPHTAGVTVSAETISSKWKFQEYAHSRGVIIKNNGVYASAEFKADCAKKDQNLFFAPLEASE